jgi:hypothetical protein
MRCDAVQVDPVAGAGRTDALIADQWSDLTCPFALP